MASNDLNYLYSVKKTIENYYAVERSNEKVNQAQSNANTAVANNKKALLEKNAQEVQKVKRNSFLKKQGFIILLSGLLAIVFFFFASLTVLSDVISPNIDTVVNNYEEYIEEGGKAPEKKFDDFDKSRQRKLLTDTSLALISGNIILVTLVVGLIALFVCAAITKESDSQTYVTAGAFALCAVAIVFIFLLPSHSRNVWGLSPSIGTLGIVFKGLFYSVFGIGRIFTVTHSYFFFLVILQVIFYATLITFVRARETFKLPKSALNKLAALEAEKKKIESDAQAKYLEISKTWEAKKNPNKYASPYFALPKYLQNYSTVCSLIWAIENGYAYDIVGARNYWDRKAHDAAVQRQLNQIKSTADAALRAAQTPPDVTVNVTVWN